MSVKVDDFVQKHMRKAGRFVPARLQAALALLEKLRDKPSLRLEDHLAGRGSSGLESHETYGNRAHQRLRIHPINKNHGRRSSNLQDWGQDLLDMLKAQGLADGTPVARSTLIHQINQAQQSLASVLRGILEQEPLEAHSRGRSVEAVIRELLCQADEKGKTGDVAQYLIGAKLMLRFQRDIPVYPANKADRKSWLDRKPRYGDFEMENVVIEVAVGLPDEKHTAQVAEVLEETDSEVWLLTRTERVAVWRDELEKAEGVDTRRVIVASVESFIGQNLTELGEFSAKRKAEQLHALVDLYNARWADKVGTPGIRIALR